jgi:hypothetical protein
VTPDIPSRRHPRRARVLASLILATAACEYGDTEPVAPPGTGEPARAAYAAPLRTDAELRASLGAVCRAAQQRTPSRVLVEFSAAWCGDCRRLHEMKRTPPLSRELEQWPRIVINVGQFDRHRSLLEALDVQRIAHWSIFEPVDCTAPLHDWPRILSRTLEVSSGEARDLTPSDLAGWLADQANG